MLQDPPGPSVRYISISTRASLIPAGIVKFAELSQIWPQKVFRARITSCGP